MVDCAPSLLLPSSDSGFRDQSTPADCGYTRIVEAAALDGGDERHDGDGGADGVVVRVWAHQIAAADVVVVGVAA